LDQSAQAGQAQWGDRVPVLVAAEDIPAGTELDQTNAHLRPYPLALLPHGAMTELDAGRHLNYPVSVGQVIVARQSSGDRHGLTSGTRAVTLPQPLAAPAIEIGDSVELVAVRSSPAGAVATTLGTGAVSEKTEGEITVVVDRLLVAPIFEALGSGSVEFARRPAQG
jgi:Flp pilus assembly protein CpaB